MKCKYREEKIVVKGKYDLGATITIPEGTGDKMNAIVIVAGTGNADRDGNIVKKKVTMNIYKDLARFFAKLGFVSIRYDKRGTYESKGNYFEAGANDLVDDIISNVEYLESLEFVDKVILCGHSEGSILVSLANEKHQCSGMIQIAGAGTNLKSALEYQNYLILQEVKKLKGLKGIILRKAVNENNYLDKVNKLFNKANSTDKEVTRFQGVKIQAKWLREHDSITNEKLYDLMKNSGCPILAVTGGKDVQANPEIIDKINAWNDSNITTKVIPNMDHCLREFHGELTVLNAMKQYKSEFDKSIYPVFLDEIEAWLNSII